MGCESSNLILLFLIKPSLKIKDIKANTHISRHKLFLLLLYNMGIRSRSDCHYLG